MPSSILQPNGGSFKYFVNVKMSKNKKISEEQRLAFFQELKGEYSASIHRRMLELIARAHQEVGSIDVRVSKLEDGTIAVCMDFRKQYESNGRHYYDTVTECVSDRTPSSEEELNELEWSLDGISLEIESVKRARIEMEQMQEKKSRALGKLTAEEKKLLGLA
jgi:hypothetical protein